MWQRWRCMRPIASTRSAHLRPVTSISRAGEYGAIGRCVPAAANGRAEMMTSMTSTDLLVEALAKRLRLMDMVGWQRIAMLAEQSELSFEDLRLLLAFAMKVDDGSAAVSELADLAGFSLDVAYPAIHSLRSRGYVREERRQYVLSEHGKELVAALDAAHRDGIQAYVDRLNREELQQLRRAFAITGS